MKRNQEMKKKSYLKPVLVLVLAGVTVLLASGTNAQPQGAAPKAARHKVIAYYFHTNTRCSTCPQGSSWLSVESMIFFSTPKMR